jgi:hypothetical protein
MVTSNPHVCTLVLVGPSKTGLLVVLQKSWSISYTKMSSVQATSAAEAALTANLREEASAMLETANTVAGYIPRFAKGEY